MAFETVRIDNRLYYTVPSFTETGVVSHCFTSRLGGADAECGLDLSFRTGGKAEDVLENYKAVSEDMKFSYKNMVRTMQTHSTNIRIVTPADSGKGVTKESDIFDTDGLVTEVTGIPLVIFFADCVPLMFLDKVKRVIAVSHAGWRGTADKIGEKTVNIMQSEFGCKPCDILAAIGPSIGKCCFEVEHDTASNFDSEFVTDKGGGKYIIDLWQVNVKQLLDAGVSKKNIAVANECTVCKNDILYSYRAEGEKAGRMAAIIELRIENHAHCSTDC